MPVLKKARWEKFCQEYVKGASAVDAYERAGYKRQKSEASVLHSRPEVQERIAELQGRAAEKVEMTVAKVVENLVRIAEKAEQLEDSPGYAVARSAWMDAAKVSGLIVEKKEVRSGHLDELPADAVAELREQLVAERARRFDSGSRPEAGSKPH